MAQYLACWTPEQGVWAQALAESPCYVLGQAWLHRLDLVDISSEEKCGSNEYNKLILGNTSV